MPAVRKQWGFTLIELAMVMIILGLLLGGLLQPLGKVLEHKRQQQAREMLQTAVQRLEAFVLLNGRLPCPASETSPLSVDYGLEDCTAALLADQPLPWRNLDMPEIDPWGSRRHSGSQSWAGYLHYRVDPALAQGVLTTATIGNKDLTIVVRDSQGRQLTNKGDSPVAIVCSYGGDRIANGENASSEAAPEATYQVAVVPTAGFDDQCAWLSRLSLLYRLVQTSKLP